MTHSSKTFTNFLILCHLLFYTTRSVTKYQFQCSNFILIVSHEHFYYAALARQVSLAASQILTQRPSFQLTSRQ